MAEMGADQGSGEWQCTNEVSYSGDTKAVKAAPCIDLLAQPFPREGISSIAKDDAMICEMTMKGKE